MKTRSARSTECDRARPRSTCSRRSPRPTYHRLARIHELVVAEEKDVPKMIVSGRHPKERQRSRPPGKCARSQWSSANDEAEASLRGAAVYALEKLGFQFPNSDSATHPSPSSTPAQIQRRA
jgi:hypothetical protein